jgi:hypothetical protein
VRTVAKIVGGFLALIFFPAALAGWLLLAGSIVLWVLYLFGVEEFLGFTPEPLESGDEWVVVFPLVATGGAWLAAKLLSD